MASAVSGAGGHGRRMLLRLAPSLLGAVALVAAWPLAADECGSAPVPYSATYSLTRKGKLEVVPSKRTSAETVEFTRQTLLAMNKVPFLAPNIAGFWVNRFRSKYILFWMYAVRENMIMHIFQMLFHFHCLPMKNEK